MDNRRSSGLARLKNGFAYLRSVPSRSLGILRAEGPPGLARRGRSWLKTRFTASPVPVDYTAWARLHVPARDGATRGRARVLVQTHELTLTGVPIIARDQALDLAARGSSVAVVSAAPGELVAAYAADGIPAIVDPLILDSPERAGADVLLRSFDVLLANTVMAWRLVLAARSIGMPVLWVIQEGQFGIDMVREEAGLREALRLADRVVFSSRQTAARYRAVCGEMNSASMLFGVEAPPGLPAVPPLALDRPLRIVHIGSVERRKGQDVLIDAVRRLAPHVRERLDVSFVGRTLDGTFHRRQRLDAAGLANVRWLGGLDQRRTWERLAESDVLVCSSRDETGPLVVYEAMCLGKVVVSTPVGGVPEVIEDEVNGLLFPVGDAGRLGELLARVASDRASAARLGRAALATYEKMLTRRQSNDRIARLLQTLSGLEDV